MSATRSGQVEPTSRRARLFGYVVGAGLSGFGGWTLLTQNSWPALRSVAVWFAGGVLGHDAVLAPAVAVGGLLVLRVVPPAARAPIQAGLVLTGCLALATVPLVLGWGRDPTVPSQQPLSYGPNLLAVLGAVWLAVLGIAAARTVRAHRRAA